MKKILSSMMATMAVMFTAGIAAAQEGAAAVAGAAQEAAVAGHEGAAAVAAAAGAHQGLMAIAIAIGIGIAALGGALGQGRAVSAALEGISRNPNAADKVFVPMILGLAFMESLVLFTWVLMFLLLGKI